MKLDSVNPWNFFQCQTHAQRRPQNLRGQLKLTHIQDTLQVEIHIFWYGFQGFALTKELAVLAKARHLPSCVQLQCPAGFSLMYCIFLLCLSQLSSCLKNHLSRELPISWHLFKPHPFHVSFYNCHAHKTLSLNTL